MNIHFISAFAESEFMHSFLRNTTLTDTSCPHIPEFLSTACPGQPGISSQPSCSTLGVSQKLHPCSGGLGCCPLLPGLIDSEGTS